MTKLIYCKDYPEFKCCETCHTTDEMFSFFHKGFEITACCTTVTDIQNDIDKHDESEYKK